MMSHASPEQRRPVGPVQPYFDWAVDTGFAYLRPGEWLPLLVEFDASLTRDRFVSLSWLDRNLRDAVRVPALFEQSSSVLSQQPHFSFCVLLVRRKRAALLVLDNQWRKTIRRAELGPPIDLPSSLKAKSVAAPQGLHARPRAESQPILNPAQTAIPLSTITGQQGTNGARVVTAVIDQGIAFAHSRFSHATGTRIAYLWLQDLMSGLGPPDLSVATTQAAIQPALSAAMASTPGLELAAIAIDAGVQAAQAQGGDADTVYRAVGCIDFATSGFKPLARRRSHGTHVLDLAAGEDPSANLTSRPIIAVDMPEDAVGDPAGSSLTVHAAWGLMYILSRADAMRQPGEKLGVVVNISYGPQDGPHDGSSLFECFADRLIGLCRNSNTPLQVVLAAGNFRQSRVHAGFVLAPAGAPQQLTWHLQPGGLTPSFMELWLPSNGGAGVSVTLRSPEGDAVTVAPNHLKDAKPPMGTPRFSGSYVPGSPAQPRSSILLWIAPTAVDPATTGGQATAPSGTWSVEVSNLSGSKLRIQAWIRRSDTPGGRRAKGRQSYFDDAAYELDRHLPSTRPKLFDQGSSSYVKRQGTLSGIATGKETVVVGGYRRKPKPWNPSKSVPKNPASSWYSSQGPAAPGGSRTAKAPNWLAPSDDAATCPGVLAAGTHDGSCVAMNGTSVAAPQAARYLAREFAASSNWGLTPPAGLDHVSSEVPASDRALVAGDGLMDLPATRGRR